MILKGVLPVEDHEFQIVTQIQIFKLQYWKKKNTWWEKYRIFPFPEERQHWYPLEKANRLQRYSVTYAGFCLISLSRKRWEGNFPLSQSGKEASQPCGGSPHPSPCSRDENLPSFSRRNKSGQERKYYDQFINLRGCVWGLSRGPDPQLFYPLPLQGVHFEFSGLPTEWTNNALWV